MKLQRLEVRNFRSIESEILDLGRDNVVLVGKDAQRKKAILEAAAIAVGSLFFHFRDVNSRNIRPSDVRQVENEKQYPVVIACEAQYSDRHLQWTRSLEKEGGGTTIKQASEIVHLSKEIQDRVMGGDSLILPAIAYYNLENIQKKHSNIKATRPKSRILGNACWFDAKLNNRYLWEWFKIMELIQRQNGVPRKTFIAVQSAIQNYDRHIENIYFDLHEDKLKVKETGKGDRELGTEERDRFLCLVADLAYRLAVLNPQLESDVVRLSPGIILIDNMNTVFSQNELLVKLMQLTNIFTNVQFVMSSDFSLPVLELETDIKFRMVDCSSGEYAKAA